MAVERIKSGDRGRGRPSLADVLARVDEEVRLLHEHLGGLPRAVEADQILRAIWIDDVHHSTAIEGNTMTRAQVAALVEHGRASGTLVESADVAGYSRAADWAYGHAEDYAGVPVAVVSELHRQAVEFAWHLEPPVTRDAPGAWRQTAVQVRRVRVSLPAAIPADLQAWSDSTRQHTAGGHPLIHVAQHHAWFERIHPFVDGNGRVGRLVMNFMLRQQGYPPAVITERGKYLHALALADQDNPHRLAEVIARAVSDALVRLLIPKLAGTAKLVPLSALTGGASTQYLRLLVQRGRLKALRHGNLWLSSRIWLNEYLASRHPSRGRRRRTRVL